MVNSYHGAYYNGQSAKPENVLVSFESSGLRLFSVETKREVAFLLFENVVQLQSFGKRHVLMLKPVDLPQSLEVEGHDFIESYKLWDPRSPHLKDAHRFFDKFGKKGILMALGFLAGFVLLTYFVLIPSAIKFTAKVFPKEYEISMGQSLYKEYMKTFEQDTARTVFINQFYQALNVSTEYPIHITVVKQNEMNAFALPGGEIVVYSGILDSMKNYNELIGLLGHEVGHIEKRHSLQMIIKNLSNYMLISLVFQDYSGTLAVVAENAAAIEELSYSRDAESESDEFGYATIMLNQGDPVYMATMFERMLEENKMADKVPSFLLTHPKLEERVAVIKAKIEQEEPDYQHKDTLQYLFTQAREGVALN